MSDYIMIKSFTLDTEGVEAVPAREAVAALHVLNQKLEESRPQGEPVEAYPAEATTAHIP